LLEAEPTEIVALLARALKGLGASKAIAAKLPF
jgi:hypothetical protein